MLWSWNCRRRCCHRWNEIRSSPQHRSYDVSFVGVRPWWQVIHNGNVVIVRCCINVCFLLCFSKWFALRVLQIVAPGWPLERFRAVRNLSREVAHSYAGQSVIPVRQCRKDSSSGHVVRCFILGHSNFFSCDGRVWFLGPTLPIALKIFGHILSTTTTTTLSSKYSFIRVAVHHKRHRIHQSSSLVYSHSVITSIVAVTHSSWIGIDRKYRDHDYGNDRSMDGSSIDGLWRRFSRNSLRKHQRR